MWIKFAAFPGCTKRIICYIISHFQSVHETICHDLELISINDYDDMLAYVAASICF